MIEGLDGSGKTEVAFRLAQVLEQAFPNQIKLTFEPHDPSCAGLFIRQVLKKRIADVAPRTLALAYAANRADHNAREINIFLENGPNRLVICDRYYLSSLVYQTVGLSLDEVMAINSGARQPDLTLFMNVSAETCYQRMQQRPGDEELFDRNLDATRQKYMAAIDYVQARGDTVVEIDANPPIDVVLASMVDVLVGGDGPEWLTERPDLTIRNLYDVFSLADMQSPTLAAFVADLRPFPPDVAALRTQVRAQVAELSFDAMGALFMNYLRRSGYAVIERLPWDDLHAFALEYPLPGGMMQHGTALLLGGSQRYDSITRKVLDLEQLADFMFIFDPRDTQLFSTYFERDVVVGPGGAARSPSTVILNRDDLADCVLAVALAKQMGVAEDAELHQAVLKAVQNYGLGRYWAMAQDVARVE